jgi:UDP-N-acetylmuramyl pentapeptide synthase
VAVSHAPQSASILRPNIALLTNVSEAHLVWHKSLEEIADFKSAVFRYLEPQGTAVICRDTELFERVRMHASRPDLKVITYGTHADADWRLEKFDPLTGDANYVFESQRVTLNIKAGSQHQAVNLAGALACLAAAGEDWRDVAGHLKNWSPIAGRGVSFSIQTTNGSRALVVDDAFNAAPIAMKAAIKALAERKEAKRRVLVLGEMLELGDASKELHTRLAEVVAAHSIDCVYAVGKVYDEFWEQLPVCRRGKHVSTREDLHLSILADARDGDIWWIKGAHGSGLHYEVAKLHAMKIV